MLLPMDTPPTVEPRRQAAAEALRCRTLDAMVATRNCNRSFRARDLTRTARREASFLSGPRAAYPLFVRCGATVKILLRLVPAFPLPTA